MRIRTSAKGLTLKRLQKNLQDAFPEYGVKVFGRQVLVSKGLLEGVGVVTGKGYVSVRPVPASLASMLVLAALLALLVVPGLIFLGLCIARSGPLTREIGEHLADTLESQGHPRAS